MTDKRRGPSSTWGTAQKARSNLACRPQEMASSPPLVKVVVEAYNYGFGSAGLANEWAFEGGWLATRRSRSRLRQHRDRGGWFVFPLDSSPDSFD